MTRRKANPVNIITVSDKNNTYTASWNGEKKSCTAGAENAARLLAEKLLGIPASTVTLKQHDNNASGNYRYEVIL